MTVVLMLTVTVTCFRGIPRPGEDAGTGADADCEPAHEVCDISPQCGCPAGQRCVPGPDGRRCVDNGELPHGAECDADEECADGFCHDSIAHVCRQPCLENEECAELGPGSTCILSVEVGEERLRICTVDCDPLTGAGCPEGIQCNVEHYLDWPCHTDCRAESTPGTVGAECMEHMPYQCAVGTLCVEGRCRLYCIVGEPCDGGGECVPHLDEPCVVDGAEYGVCM